MSSSSLSINAVIFDLGNVLFRWDPRFLYEKLIDDPAELDYVLDKVVPLDWHSLHDAGLPMAEGIARRIALYPDYAPLIRAFKDRWPETFGGPIAGTVEIVGALAGRGVPLYALTNFSAETYPAFAADFPAMRHFRDVLVSGEVKLVKPDPRIYRLAIRRFGVDPARTLFIDDREENVEAARREGLQARRFTGPDALRADLRALDLL